MPRKFEWIVIVPVHDREGRIEDWKAVDEVHAYTVWSALQWARGQYGPTADLRLVTR